MPSFGRWRPLTAFRCSMGTVAGSTTCLPREFDSVLIVDCKRRSSNRHTTVRISDRREFEKRLHGFFVAASKRVTSPAPNWMTCARRPRLHTFRGVENLTISRIGQGRPLRAALPTPPYMRVRIRRFGEDGRRLGRLMAGQWINHRCGLMGDHARWKYKHLYDSRAGLGSIRQSRAFCCYRATTCA